LLALPLNDVDDDDNDDDDDVTSVVAVAVTAAPFFRFGGIRHVTVAEIEQTIIKVE
jgi:hypothetical protein